VIHVTIEPSRDVAEMIVAGGRLPPGRTNTEGLD